MDAKQQVVDRLKQANNVLVTVRTNPSVDLLSACIGLSLALDKLDKHAAAVFSGKVPSTLEFLKPEETIEPTPNSLRDFIIALDKSKADKLRYKVEDKVVRIFITPYKTSISQDDLEFSQGDFNVDVIVALGAHSQEELDEAITAHGRILHDAAVISINNTPNGNLGSVSWQEISASSISEMSAELVQSLGKNILNEQISTALLTGIVAETRRFSNEKTTPNTMAIAGALMAAGANQQLVASQLQASSDPLLGGGTASRVTSNTSSQEAPRTGDGTLEIEHEAAEPLLPRRPFEQPDFRDEGPDVAKIAPRRTMLPTPEPRITNVHASPLAETPFTQEYEDMNEQPPQQGRSYLIAEPTLPTNTPKGPERPTEPSHVNPSDVLPIEPRAPILNRETVAPYPQNASPFGTTGASSPVMAQPAVMPPTPPSSSKLPDGQTLQQIEESVHSPHLTNLHADVDVARNQVLEALKQGPRPLEPLAALNANPLSDNLHPSDQQGEPTPPAITVDDEGNMQQINHDANTTSPATPNLPPSEPMDMPLPTISPAQPPVSSPIPPNAPPSVPPPFPPFTNPGTHL